MRSRRKADHLMPSWLVPGLPSFPRPPPEVTPAETWLHARSLLRLGLLPGLAVVVYFWHLSLPSSRSKARKEE